jgi:hypothetical protein
MINDETPAFLSNELVANIDEATGMATISCPFSLEDIYFSPELVNLKELPAFIHFKVAYFSLALFILHLLSREEDTFYIEYVKHKQLNIINKYLDNHIIKESKLYWLLSRCLDEDPNKRSFIYI